MGIFREIKDSSVSYILKTAANYFFSDLGSVTNFSIDSGQKRITLVASLKGEVQPITIQLISYELIEERNKLYLSFAEIQTSRDWIDTLFAKYIEVRKLELPNRFVKQLL